ncbi:MAG TPA: efflux RND transporter periplasmic adaptor subunit [Ideonella sp.]|nr:efflux RND transporter periplasmic adaptor subunit [Ideonella sp.]
MSTTPEALPSTANGRRRGLTLVAVAVLLCGAAYGTWYYLHARHHQSTDNAYVQGNVVQITPQVGGTVISINADDNDFVRAGQPLVKLDQADARLALDQAEAQLGQTVREVRTLFANNTTQQAQIALREADLTRMQADLARAQDDVNRRAPLVASGAVGKEEFQHATSQLASARSAVGAAQSAVLAAREQLSANQSLTDGTSIEQHPNVQRAAARVREAYLALKRSELLAPVDGHIAKRGVQVGQRVQAGAPLMTVVALDRLWVDANFKESQLKELRIGQPAELEADVYGQKVVFHGKVSGLGAGTGSAFSLLPAQNATGNWIKIVQRVPVRITLDPKELAQHPLRLGLSMDVTVDTQEQSGKAVAEAPRTEPVASTAVFDSLDHDATAEVERIVQASLGRRATVAAARPAAAAAGKAADPANPAIAQAPGKVASAH